ncbi:hypothetical protein [Nocardia brasiliensis]|uniref:hypothetical protein n=1 Tax=Nocardia brasiliensis TaxID=37326 RepID=UPI002455B0E9|nr:hypothetical protein [Nocardia brasiliensis]
MNLPDQIDGRDDDLADDPVSNWLAIVDARNALLPDDEERRGWVQYENGAWSAVDSAGCLSEPVTIDFAALASAETPALPSAAIDIEPIAVTDTEAEE